MPKETLEVQLVRRCLKKVDNLERAFEALDERLKAIEVEKARGKNATAFLR